MAREGRWDVHLSYEIGVVMANEKVVKDVKDVKVDSSQTDWSVFERANLVPLRVSCQDYQPIHPSDGSCHTNLQLTGENITRHMEPEHGSGGGFTFHLRQREGAKNPLWKELTERKVELHDFRCDVCDEILPLAGRRIVKHLSPHAGKSRSVRQGGAFHLTLRFDRPDQDVEDEQF